jgi:hypothetical protein
MSDRFYEISGQWMKACGKGDQPKVVRVISASNNHPTMTALTVDMGDGHTWTVIAEWRGRFVEAPQAETIHAQGDREMAALAQAVAQLPVKFTQVNLRTIAEEGEKACISAYAMNVVAGEGPTTCGGGDARIGANMINAGRKLAARDGIDVRTHRDYRI